MGWPTEIPCEHSYPFYTIHIPCILGKYIRRLLPQYSLWLHVLQNQSKTTRPPVDGTLGQVLEHIYQYSTTGGWRYRVEYCFGILVSVRFTCWDSEIFSHVRKKIIADYAENNDSIHDCGSVPLMFDRDKFKAKCPIRIFLLKIEYDLYQTVLQCSIQI